MFTLKRRPGSDGDVSPPFLADTAHRGERREEKAVLPLRIQGEGNPGTDPTRPPQAPIQQGPAVVFGPMAQGLFRGNDSNIPNMKRRSPLMRPWQISLPPRLLPSIPPEYPSCPSHCLAPVDHTPACFLYLARNRQNTISWEQPTV